MWNRLRELTQRRKLDRELDEEVALHLALLEEEFRRKGMDPATARNAARREFGGVAHAKESYRAERGWPWLENLGRDVRYALRGLGRNRVFAAAAILSLALGIGVNTAIFTMFHALMLRMLPVAQPEQLVLMYRTGGWGAGYSSYPLYLEIRKRDDLFSGVVARSGVDKVRFQEGAADRQETLEREYVSGNYFSVLGVPAAIGRLLTDDDNRTPHAHPLAVLSYDFWRRRLGGDQGVLGRKLVVGHQPLTVIGVAAPGFRGVEVDHHPDLWEPAMMLDGDLMDPNAYWAWIVARRRPEVPSARVQAAIDVLLKQHLAALYGSHRNAAYRRTAMAQQIEVRPAGIGISMLRERFSEPLWVLMAAVGLVLLAACANVAHLLLARGAAQRKEVALRLALGASRARLVRQALTESLLLAGLGGILGVLLAVWGEGYILHFLPASAGQPFDIAPDGAVLAFTLAISVFSVLLFGLAPALRSTAVDPAAGMHSGTGGAGDRRPILRRALVTAQVAFSVVLVAMAGLFAHSLRQLRSVDLGFRNQNVTFFEVEFPAEWKPEQYPAARERLLGQLAELPGVSAVSFGAPGPFLGGFSNSSMRVPGSAATAKEPVWVNVQRVEPRYFDIIGSRLLAGREFDRNDSAAARQVAVVNEAFLHAYLPGEAHPLDRTLSFDEQHPVYIVGIVRDMPHQGLRQEVAPTVYAPVRQGESNWGDVLVRSPLPPEGLATAIRREVNRFVPQLDATEPKTIRQRIDDSIFQDRMLATLGGFFGALALLLAGIGLYGVVSYGTARRAGEIGIRVALGARGSQVLWMVLRDALLLVAAGLAIGLPASLALAQKVAALLFNVKPTDLVAFASTACVLVVAALAAAFVPARRAASLDPMRALRHE